MNNKYKEQSINNLNIEGRILEILEKNNICNLSKLCEKSKTELKRFELTQKEIDKIEIKLQLMGLNLRGSL